jgi:hypothetical protein
MAHDYEDVFDLDDLNDDELRSLVRDRLAAHAGLDIDDITVSVEDGVVKLEGRVGTEQEQRVALRVVTDEIGVRQVENELVVDPIRRAENPEAIDDELGAESRREGLLLGDRPVPIEPSAETQDEELEQDVVRDGTTDVQDVIRFGGAWIPPERPTPEGLGGEESRAADMGEDH